MAPVDAQRYDTGMPRIRISYNAPVVLTFALAAVVVMCLPQSFRETWFSAKPNTHYTGAYLGIFTHVLGHANWQHLMGNFMLILLVGPILEERYRSLPLLGMILGTALVTGLLNFVVGHELLLGASGIVFMMILLASTANIRRGDIPLTFVAVAVLYLGAEVWHSFNKDNISQFAHLVGGAVGAAFGFFSAGNKKSPGQLADPKARAIAA